MSRTSCTVLQVLAHIFMARCDTAYSVRTAAVHVWKTVVVNTPRTTTEILPVLMNHLIEALASPGETQHRLAPGASPCLLLLLHTPAVLHQYIRYI